LEDSVAIRYNVEYPAPPQQVWEVLTNKDFPKEYVKELQASSYEAEVKESEGVWSIYLRLVAPTDQIPSIFRGLVGSEIVIDDRREWVADGNGGYRGKLNVEANAKGRKAIIRGSLTLKPSSAGTEFVALGETKFNVPFIGGMARKGIDQLCVASFEDESKVLLRVLNKDNL
jgi:hypothetical protein